jgi:hypothetical protein
MRRFPDGHRQLAVCVINFAALEIILTIGA